MFHISVMVSEFIFIVWRPVVAAGADNMGICFFTNRNCFAEKYAITIKDQVFGHFSIFIDYCVGLGFIHADTMLEMNSLIKVRGFANRGP